MPVDVVGWGTKWNGWGDKVNGIRDYASAVAQENTHKPIIYLDGWDTKINNNANKALAIYLKSFPAGSVVVPCE